MDLNACPLQLNVFAEGNRSKTIVGKSTHDLEDQGVKV